jgi:hypothetical protein
MRFVGGEHHAATPEGVGKGMTRGAEHFRGMSEQSEIVMHPKTFYRVFVQANIRK